MSDPTPKTVYLKDYKPSAFLIATINLDVVLSDEYTRVRVALDRVPQSGSMTRKREQALT